MTYDQTLKFVTELADQHADKFLYCLEKPDFKSWFIGRTLSLTNGTAKIEHVENAMHELMRK